MNFRQFFGLQGARFGRVDKGRHAIVDQYRLGVGTNRRGGDWFSKVRLQLGVRHAPDVPQLHHNLATRLVHRMGYLLPAVELLGAVQARHIGIALALRADGGGLGDDEAGRGALGVVGGHQGVGYRPRSPVARQGRHDDAVGHGNLADLEGVEEGGHGFVLFRCSETDFTTARPALGLIGSVGLKHRRVVAFDPVPIEMNPKILTEIK